MNRALKIVATLMALVMVLVALPAAMAAEETHTFEVAAEITSGGDKDTVAEGTTFANGYYKVVGKVTQRWTEKKGYYAVEIAKNGTGAIEFTVTGTADVTMVVASTGSTNTSAVALLDAEGNTVANNEGLSEVYASSPSTTLTYSDLPAGTYQLVSPQSEHNRGFRVMSIQTVETTAEAPVEPSEPVAPETGVTEIYTGTTGGTGWFQVAEIYTTVWGGTLDPNFITEGGHLSIYFTGSEIWSVHFALNGAKWAQIDREIGTATQLEDGSYVVTISYADLIAAYGTNDLSGLGAVYLYTNCADTGSAVITRATYTAAKEEAPTEPTVPETTAPQAPETTAPQAPETTAPQAPETTAPAVESKTITIGDRTFTAEKWLYNTAVDATTAPGYSMIIFDKNYTGEVVTNGWGAAIVLDKNGVLVKIYDAANMGFWTVDGKSADALTFDAKNYATVAFAELQEGEILIIFPNDGTNAKDSARSFALGLRNAGTDQPCECGKVATLTGFTFGAADEVPTTTVPTTQPGGDADQTGDNTPIVLAVLLMMASAAAIVLVQKKRAF